MESGPFRVKISVLCSGELCKCLRWGLPPYQQSVVYSKWPSWPKVDVQVTNRGDRWYFHLYESVVIRREWFQWDYQSSRHRWFDHLPGHIGNPHPGGCPDSPSRERIGSLGSLCWSRFPMRNKWSKSLLHRLFCRGREKKIGIQKNTKNSRMQIFRKSIGISVSFPFCLLPLTRFGVLFYHRLAQMSEPSRSFLT